MMSLAGVPLTAGFLGKFLVFKVAFETQQFFLIALGILTVGCGFYFYLKVVKAMYWQPAAANVAADSGQQSCRWLPCGSWWFLSLFWAFSRRSRSV